MKYGVLTYTDIAPFPSGNVGDYIQSLAAIQFLPRIDVFVEREDMQGVADQGDIFLIMNGWFMHRPENFPPPKNIHPFYISFCVADERMLSSDAISHLKEHEPIGCRDIATLEALSARGVKAYFSGCLTLSLEKSTRSKKESVYIVDVSDVILKNMPDYLVKRAHRVSHLASLFREWRDIFYMGRVKFFKEGRIGKMIDFFYFVMWCIPVSIIRFLFTMRSKKSVATFLNLVRARVLLDSYSRAELVVTSRLHVALPCLAFGTPVVFFRPHYKEDHDRFTAVRPYLRLFSESELAFINWHPQPPTVEAHQKFLRLIMKEAVLIGDNPLKNRDIEYFYKESGWYPSIGVLS